RLMQTVSPADFEDERTAKLVSLLFNFISEGKKIMVNNLISYLEDENLTQIVCELSLIPQTSDEERQKVVEDCIKRLKEKRFRNIREHLQREIKLAQSLGDEERLKKLTEEFCNLMKTNKKQQV
ncbi:MAG: DUF2913 family protein, partial [Candidatus Omnitrophica bacterium]|nr:DUF2913 family protein [Candidatus Omnitrophota bacterium]